MLTRRTLIAAAACAPFAPRRVWAATSYEAGGMRIDTVSDGYLTLPGNFILGHMPRDELLPILERYGQSADQLTPPCNVTLLRDGTNTVLFDTGAGPDFQASAGRLSEALDVLGVSVDDITHVVFTHAHPDHLWGVLDDFDEPLFVNAQHMIGRAEFDYWTDPDTVNTIDETRTTFAVGAARRLNTLAGQLRLLEDGEDVLPGVVARLTPGHTLGHMAFEIAASDPVLVLGDSIANHHVAFKRPEWLSGNDQDMETAAQTRVALLERIVHEKMILIGYHLSDGGMGRAERNADGYRFVPEI